MCYQFAAVPITEVHEGYLSFVTFLNGIYVQHIVCCISSMVIAEFLVDLLTHNWI